MRANERTDERVAQYLRLYSCLFQTSVERNADPLIPVTMNNVSVLAPTIAQQQYISQQQQQQQQQQQYHMQQQHHQVQQQQHHQVQQERSANGAVTVEINDMNSQSQISTQESHRISSSNFPLQQQQQRETTTTYQQQQQRHIHQETTSSSVTTTTSTSQQPSPMLKDKNLTQIYNMHGLTQSDDSITTAMQKNYAYGNQKEYTAYATTTTTNESQDLLQFYSHEEESRSAAHSASHSPPILPPKKSSQHQKPAAEEEAEKAGAATAATAATNLQDLTFPLAAAQRTMGQNQVILRH